MPETSSDRRAFLGRLLVGTLITGVAAAFGTALAYLFPSKEVSARLGPRRVAVAGAAEIAPGHGKLTLIETEPVWIVRLPREFIAVSAICTHKGCLLDWEAKRRLFVCPCHNGQFDERGNVLSGLPRTPLRRYRVAAVDEKLFVSPGDQVHS